MAEFLINQNDLKYIIDNYALQNNTFSIISVLSQKGNTNAYRYRFVLNGKQCQMDVYYKSSCVKIVPITNVETVNTLIDYVRDKALDPNIEATQLIIPTNNNFCEEMKDSFMVEYPYISIVKENNKYQFTGYNQDKVTIHQYSDKMMIQGKPLYVFSLIMNYIAENSDISLEEYCSSLKDYSSTNQPFDALQVKINTMLGDELYNYLDDAILKTLSSSVIMLDNKQSSIEDYSGYVTGAFKTLEGYLKKVLSQFFHYQFKTRAFEMFKKINGNWTLIPGTIACTEEQEAALVELYTVFSSKRNTYLHAAINPAMTALIRTYMDAQSIVDEIVAKLKKSHIIFFGVKK